ncbi:MAG: hypothetical protein SFU25_07605 [Candidatus Caenarcaniphilales bacterium]|nr:hypothetical protein [Candidatus Caenarcaniphilales bacterium]
MDRFGSFLQSLLTTFNNGGDIQEDLSKIMQALDTPTNTEFSPKDLPSLITSLEEIQKMETNAAFKNHYFQLATIHYIQSTADSLGQQNANSSTANTSAAYALAGTRDSITPENIKDELPNLINQLKGISSSNNLDGIINSSEFQQVMRSTV